MLVVLVAGYLAVTAVLARHGLQDARREVAAVKQALLDGDEAAARAHLARADRFAGRADALTSGPVWAAAAAVPQVGKPLDTVRGIASTAHDLTSRVLPAVAAVATDLTPDRLHTRGSTLRTGPLQAAAPALTTADAATRSALGRLRGLPADTWLPPVDAARRDFLDLLTGLGGSLHTADIAAHVAPSMLGADGPRRYLMAFENDAESRGLGGLPGAYAVLRVDGGTISFERFGNDTDITAAASVDLGADFADRYDPFRSRLLFTNSDMSPHFPAVAQIWLSMWEAQTGERLDGAIATDPTALAGLLRVTGPARLADGTVLSAETIIRLTESEAYARFPDTPTRKRFFVQVARAVADHVIGSVTDRARAVVSAFGRAADERRLLIWSAHPEEEARLAALPVAGVLPETTAPFTALAVNNAAGTKLDYYLDRTVHWTPGGCAGGRRSVVVTVDLHNDAPRHGLPPYVTIRADEPHPLPPPGTNRLLVSLYATTGAQIQGLSVDGRDRGIVTEKERGHPVYTTTVELRPGATRHLEFRLYEPDTPGPVRTVRQPLVRPLVQTVDPPRC